MKHINHRIVSAGVAAIAGAGPVAILGAVAGSVLPDFDIPLGIPHRTITHWWPLYAIAFGAPWLATTNPILHQFFLWVAIGSVLHILEDSLTVGGVPLLNPFGKKFSFKVTRTGGILEYLISLGIVVAVVLLFLKDPYYSQSFKESTFTMMEHLRSLFRTITP